MTAVVSDHSLQDLYSHHHSWLQGWLRTKLGCSQRAADLAQDTYVRILAKTDPVTIQEPRAFLTKVAQRVLANFYRRQMIEKAYLDSLVLLSQEEMPSAEDQAILLQTLVEIDKLLDGLSLQVRRAFLMSQLDGLTHAEIAQELAISITTVKRHIIKGVQQCYFANC